MADSLELVLGGVVGLLGKIVYDWLSGRKQDVVAENGKAGDRSTARWELRFEEIVEKVMLQRNPMLKELIRTVIREELGRK